MSKHLAAAIAFVLLLVAALASAGEAARREVTVRLKDGSTLVGTIDREDERTVTVVTTSGVSVDVPRHSVADITPGREPSTSERAADDTELFLGPTGRPLRRGTGYFSDHWVFFPGLAYGVTDNLTLAGGASFIPGLGLGDQVVYFTPKIGARVGQHASVAVGGLFARADGVTLAAPFAVTTLGSSAHSLTAGVAFGHAGGDGSSGNSGPMLLLGGSTQVSRHLALMTENWIFPQEDFQLFSAGVRISGERLSVDLGLLFNKEIVNAGVPVPWLAFAYRFGTARPRS